MGIPCLRDKSEKSTYYEFFQKNLQKNFKKNLEFNNQYILAKKRFTQSRIDSERIENINFTWISYLLYKLNEAKRNNILIQNWKNLLYEEVKKKYFFNQFKYQNELFFQEILINKPKDQKNKNDEHFLNEEPILSPLDLEELKTYSSRDNSFSSPPNSHELIIVDPLNKQNNVAKSTFHFMNIKMGFLIAYMVAKEDCECGCHYECIQNKLDKTDHCILKRIFNSIRRFKNSN